MIKLMEGNSRRTEGAFEKHSPISSPYSLETRLVRTEIWFQGHAGNLRLSEKKKIGEQSSFPISLSFSVSFSLFISSFLYLFLSLYLSPFLYSPFLPFSTTPFSLSLTPPHTHPTLPLFPPLLPLNIISFQVLFSVKQANYPSDYLLLPEETLVACVKPLT